MTSAVADPRLIHVNAELDALMPKIDAKDREVKDAAAKVEAAAPVDKDFAIENYRNLVAQLKSLNEEKTMLLTERATLSAGGAGGDGAAGVYQMDANYLLGSKEDWTLRAKLQAGFGRLPQQTKVDFLIDTGCISFDVIIPCRKAEELGLTRSGQAEAVVLGGNRATVHRFSPAVEILVPLWVGGVEVNAPPAEVRSAWIEVWGIDEVQQPARAGQVAMLTFAHDTEEDSSAAESELGEPSTPTRQYEGTGIQQFSPLTHSSATAILGLSALTRLRLKLDTQHRRLLAVTAPRQVVTPRQC